MANSSGNLGFTMTPLPMPNAPQVDPQPYTGQSQGSQMPQNYYGGKTGSVAYMADKVLTGWLAGTKMAQQKKANAMAQEIGSAKTGLDIIGQAYRAAVESGDEAKIKQASQALSEAYQDYLNKAEKYAMPDQKIDPKTGKPKKQKGGDGNSLIPESTIRIMRQSDPKLLYGPSKGEQQQSKMLDMQTKRMEQEQAQEDRWDKIAQQDPAKMSPEDKRFLEYYEFKKFGRTPAEQKLDATKDQLLGKILDGKQPLTEQEHDLAEQFGFVKPDVISTTTRTVMDAKGNPQTQLVSIGPKGKVVGTQILPGNDYVPPNQAAIAQQTINAQMSAMMKWGAKAHPEWDKRTLTQWALSKVAGGSSGGTDDWYTKNAQMDVMNRALGAVIQKHRKEYKDPETGAPTVKMDDLGNAIMGNIVSTTDDGRYAYMPSLGPGQKEGGGSWYNPWSWGSEGVEKWSGMTRAQLNSQERQFQAELRAELKKQNPKISDAELDRMVPQMITSAQGGAQQMSPPPAAPQSGPRQSGFPQMSPPPSDPTKAASGGMPGVNTYQNLRPGPGEAIYDITLPNGSTAKRSMTPEYAEALKARGVTVKPVVQ